MKQHILYSKLLSYPTIKLWAAETLPIKGNRDAYLLLLWDIKGPIFPHRDSFGKLFKHLHKYQEYEKIFQLRLVIEKLMNDIVQNENLLAKKFLRISYADKRNWTKISAIE